jgi:hypothetical protein
MQNGTVFESLPFCRLNSNHLNARFILIATQVSIMRRAHDEPNSEVLTQARDDSVDVLSRSVYS